MQPKSPEDPYLFISYSHKDGPRVRALLDYLDSENVCFWFDDKTHAGEEWDEVIADKLLHANYVLLFVSSNSVLSKNCNGEIIMALNHDVIVIPIFIEDVPMPPKWELKIGALNMVKLTLKDEAANLALLLEQIPAECIPNKKKKERCPTKLYIGNDAKEMARLKLQTEIVQRFDGDVFARFLKGKSDLCVLDFGSNDGTTASLRFSGRPEVSLILGFELYREAIEKGKKKYAGGKMHLYQCDLEDDSALETIKTALKIHARKKADIILCSYILLHLGDPSKVLRLARTLLAPDGVIIIIDIDDGIRFYYPDPNQDFEHAIEIEGRTPATGFRNCGRSLYSCLRNSGFTRVALEKVGLNTGGMDYDQKDAFFAMSFSYMLPKLEKLCHEKPGDKALRRDYDWFLDHYDSLHEQFVAETFFAFSPVMIFSAQK
jgi:SAM-dependent methyltransferase